MPDFGSGSSFDSGDDGVESLLIDVRASTQGFAQDVAAMRGTFDATLVDGFSRAGNVLERGLVGAIRRGSLGFDDLRRIALNVINDIAAQAVGTLFSGSGGGGGLFDPGGLFGAGRGGQSAQGGGIAGLLGFGGLLGSILGLPGRATGGDVAPGRGFLVGERGPELFVPASAGRIEPLVVPASPGNRQGPVPMPARIVDPGRERFLPGPGMASAAISPPREVRVSINVTTPQASGAPQALQRSTRQVASAVRRALAAG